jgi:hypothetical protein
VRFEKSLSVGAHRGVFANGLIKVSDGLAMEERATIGAATNMLVVTGGLHATDATLEADQLISLSY